jgi:hypothetical protein
MDGIALSSIRELARRMRCAGDTYSEIRCAMHHGFGAGGMGLWPLGFGGPIGHTSFRPLLSSDEFWTCFLFSEERRRCHIARGVSDQTEQLSEPKPD